MPRRSATRTSSWSLRARAGWPNTRRLPISGAGGHYSVPGAEAETDFRQLTDTARAIDRPYLLIGAYHALAELCAAEGQATEADRHHAAARAASLQIQRPSADALALDV
jgi:hypothetical protein